MGRPRKEPSEAQPPVEETVDVNLKDCPKCGSPAREPYRDPHGNWRCNCGHPKCGFWDSMVYTSAAAAAAGWNAAGGPNKEGSW